MNKQSLSSNKILVICGPTATGKTTLGLKIAKKFSATDGGDILSSDSRQVYKGMDIITGKDIPLNSKFQMTNVKYGRVGYWETQDRVKIWLVDLLEPIESFTVSKWVSAARKIIDSLWKEKKLPVVVGATGFYIKVLLDGMETLGVAPNRKLRARLNYKDVNELFEILGQLDALRAAKMNESDRKNPRRLIRAIEIAIQQNNPACRQAGHKVPVPKKLKADILMIGLTAPRDILYKKIDKRVDKRLKQGALAEVKNLLAKGVSWNSESMTGTGYRQLRPYFDGKIALEEAIEHWKIAEHRDSKKQLTWFKKDKRIKWFDITEPSWKRQVEKTVRDWYYRGNSLARDIVTRS